MCKHLGISKGPVNLFFASSWVINIFIHFFPYRNGVPMKSISYKIPSLIYFKKSMVTFRKIRRLSRRLSYHWNYFHLWRNCWLPEFKSWMSQFGWVIGQRFNWMVPKNNKRRWKINLREDVEMRLIVRSERDQDNQSHHWSYLEMTIYSSWLQ